MSGAAPFSSVPLSVRLKSLRRLIGVAVEGLERTPPRLGLVQRALGECIEELNAVLPMVGGKKAPVGFSRQVLEGKTPNPDLQRLMIELVKEAGVKVQDVVGDRRGQRWLALRRKIACALRTEYGASSEEVGVVLRRSHTVILDYWRADDAEKRKAARWTT